MGNRNNKHLILGLTATALLSACGGESYRQTARQGSVDQPLPGISFPTPTVAPNIPTDPSMSFSFNLSGNGGTKPTYSATGIYTDNLLRVTINAQGGGGLALPSGGYSNYSASYNCVSYEITVNGRTERTKVLAVNSGGSFLCPNAPQSQTIDFSDRLGPNPGAVTVTVKNPKYDVYCQYLYTGWIAWSSWAYQNYCNASLFPVYRTHTVNGALDITINGSN